MRRLAALALSLAACRATDVYTVSVDTASLEVVENKSVGGDLQVHAGGALLARSIEVTNPRKREVSGLVEIQFDLHNRTLREKRFDYRFEWADAAGMLVDAPSAHWTPVVLGGHETLPVGATAPRVDAVRCTLKVRLSR